MKVGLMGILNAVLEYKGESSIFIFKLKIALQLPSLNLIIYAHVYQISSPNFPFSFFYISRLQGYTWPLA